MAIAAEPVRDAAWVVREGVLWRLGDLLSRAVANRPKHSFSRALDAIVELLRRLLDGGVMLLGLLADSPLGDLMRSLSDAVVRGIFRPLSNSVVGDRLRRLLEILKLPLERLTWAFERTALWPVQERLGDRGGLAARAGLATMVVGAGVLALSLLANGGSQPAARTALDPLAAPPVKVGKPASEAVAPSPAPTLDGAAPNFRPPPGSHTAKASRAIPKDAASPTAPSTASSTAGGEKGAAGPAALKVAHRFADAFVLYETGQIGTDVRSVFSETATTRLSKALLRRPPRLPANVKVPQAKVVNVVAGPRNGSTYTVSVSLLRVGITSELRVSMQRDTLGEWQVTDVLG
jgi:hypothetical protein